MSHGNTNSVAKRRPTDVSIFDDSLFGNLDSIFGPPAGLFNRRSMISRMLPSFGAELGRVSALMDSGGGGTIKREGDDLVATFDIPGVDPNKGLNISVRGNTLSVKAEREVKREENNSQGYESSSYLWEINLPAKVTSETQVVAQVNNGVLSLTVPGIYAQENSQEEAITIPVKTTEETPSIQTQEGNVESKT